MMHLRLGILLIMISGCCYVSQPTPGPTGNELFREIYFKKHPDLPEDLKQDIIGSIVYLGFPESALKAALGQWNWCASSQGKGSDRFDYVYQNFSHIRIRENGKIRAPKGQVNILTHKGKVVEIRD